MDSAIDFSGSVSKALTPPPSVEKDEPKPTFDSLLGNIGRGAEEAKNKVAAYQVEEGKLGKPPVPTLPPKPETKQTDPIEAWGSIAMVFAALASTRVRNHATTAMNAAAAALNGIKARDKEIADQKFKEWETETRNTIELAHFQQDAYKTLLESVQHKETLAMEEGRMLDAADQAKLHTLTVALQDPVMWDAYQHGGVKAAMGIQETREKQEREYKEKKLELSKNYNVWRVSQDMQADPKFQAAGPVEKANMLADALKPFQVAGSGRGYTPFTSEQREQNAANMADLKQPMFSDAVISHSPSANDTNQRARELAKLRGFDLSNASYDELKKQEYNASSGTDGRAIRSLTTVKQHLDLMDVLIGQLPDASDAKAFNWAVMSLARQMSNEHVSDFETAKQVVVNEVLKAITGTGGQMAARDREELENVFNPSKSKNALYHVSHTIKELVSGQIQGMAQQYSKFKPAREVMPIGADTLRSMFINPDTGQIEKSLVKWDEDRIKALEAGQPAPPMPPIKGAKTIRPDGKADQVWYLSNGRRVYESDGSPVEE